MSQIKNKLIVNLILAISIFALISAYFVEHILGHKPCVLCIIQRFPYFFSILIILFLVVTKKYEKLIIILLSLVFIFGTILSFYHFGIEQGFFKESMLCLTNNETNILTKEELLKELKNSKISCKNVSFSIFGLSLSLINMITSLILSIITTKIFFNYDKNKKI
tara:strand:- start:89 stop:580 length:492 start_codon:yes stop_codon:yes gene_type:complete